MNFWDAATSLPASAQVALAVALLIAFAFEFINGFHDTANAVATVIYTRSLPATPAVLFSGLMNFLGVLLGGTAVAFGIVNLLPVDLLVANPTGGRVFGPALVTVLALLLAGVVWNLGTWYLGLPVSSSHTLIGSILGVGIANGLWTGKGALSGLNWYEVEKVGLSLLLSPVLGFVGALLLLLGMRVVFRQPRLYVPPAGDDTPPWWIRLPLIGTCGLVSYAHGANDGQKGMGLLLLVLIGFMPLHYALSVTRPELAPQVAAAATDLRRAVQAERAATPRPADDPLDRDLRTLDGELAHLEHRLAGVTRFDDAAHLPLDKAIRWEVRENAVLAAKLLKKLEADPGLPADLRGQFTAARKGAISPAVEYVPLWVVVGTALALGIGTTVGYKRIVETVAEKIGKQHLTYAQGAAAETVAAVTIYGAAELGLPVSTTQVLNSGVAGTMIANGTGIQRKTVTKILLAWVCTLPACMLLAGLLFVVGRTVFG